MCLSSGSSVDFGCEKRCWRFTWASDAGLDLQSQIYLNSPIRVTIDFVWVQWQGLVDKGIDVEMCSHSVVLICLENFNCFLSFGYCLAVILFNWVWSLKVVRLWVHAIVAIIWWTAVAEFVQLFEKTHPKAKTNWMDLILSCIAGFECIT